jgi:hypothetical protein
MNKNFILVFGILVLALGLYFLFVSNGTTPPEAELTEDQGVTADEGAGDYVGMTLAEAAAQAEVRGDIFRIVEIDGEPQLVTMDYLVGRINASVVDGVVTAYTVEGEETLPGAQPIGDARDTIDNPMFQTNESEGDMSDTLSSSDQGGTGGHVQLIGKSVAEAEEYAEAQGAMFRIGMIDGEPQALTRDYRPGRITAEVENNTVIAYTVE